ncbi:hypothetical protein HG530_000076 [Fusarium avenaceum]|nr:hypothetical protein HG530_000076 [Fusarium avenaceum]
MLCFGEYCISAALDSSAFQNLQINGQLVALQDTRLMLEKLDISFLGRQAGLGESGSKIDADVVLLIGGVGIEEAIVDVAGLVETLSAVGNLSSSMLQAPFVLYTSRLKDCGSLAEFSGFVERIRIFEGNSGLEYEGRICDGAEGILEAIEFQEGYDAGVLTVDVVLVSLESSIGGLEDFVVVFDGGLAQ